jgi:hypothetical protein
VSEELTASDVQTALSLRVPVRGRQRAVRMAIRTTGDVIRDAREDAPADGDSLPYLVLDLIDTVDGEPPGLADARDICRDAEALRTLLTARNELWNRLRTNGRVLLRCPHCRARESSFALSTLMLALGTPPAPLFDAHGVFLRVPALSDPRPRGRRLTDLPVAAEVRVLLPSGLLQLDPATRTAALRDLDVAADGALEDEAAAWARWAPDDVTPPEGRAHWRRESPGFRAILRLTVALRSIDSVRDVSPAHVEALSVADFFLLDTCYALLHYVDQPHPESLAVSCENCGGTYLALR